MRMLFISRPALTSLLAAGYLFWTAQPSSCFEQEPSKSAVLAPEGELKAALYPGTPTSILKDEGVNSKGVGFEIGRELAKRLSVRFVPIVLSSNSEVQDAIRKGSADIAFTNASAARAQVMDFGPPYLDIELGYLVPNGSALQSVADADQAGRKIGVAVGSTSQSVLGRDLKQAKIVAAETIPAAIGMLADGRIDAFATNKATLFEMAQKLPGSKVLEGRWGVERHAMGIPKGRRQGLPFIEEFTAEVKASGLIADAIKRAGLRGAEVAQVN